MNGNNETNLHDIFHSNINQRKEQSVFFTVDSELSEARNKIFGFERNQFEISCSCDRSVTEKYPILERNFYLKKILPISTIRKFVHKLLKKCGKKIKDF
jgi:hypothetical protein